MTCKIRKEVFITAGPNNSIRRKSIDNNNGSSSNADSPQQHRPQVQTQQQRQLQQGDDDVETMARNGSAGGGEGPYLEILEQPASSQTRFRYECEAQVNNTVCNQAAKKSYSKGQIFHRTVPWAPSLARTALTLPRPTPRSPSATSPASSPTWSSPASQPTRRSGPIRTGCIGRRERTRYIYW